MRIIPDLLVGEIKAARQLSVRRISPKEAKKIESFPLAKARKKMTRTPAFFSSHSEEVKPIQAMLSQKLWNDNLDGSKKCLQSCFIVGIASGRLNPNFYGKYTLQDAVYCYHATRNLRTLLKKVTLDEYKNFLKTRIDSFEKYTNEMFEDWQIENPDGIRLGEAARDYIQMQEKIADSNLNFIYSLIAMLPCEMLWPWLAQSIDNGDKNNLYYSWIEGNKYSGRSLEKFINQLDETALDMNLVGRIFSGGILCEFNFFSSPCKGQSVSLKALTQLESALNLEKDLAHARL